MMALAQAAFVRGDPSPLQEAFDRKLGDSYVDLLAYKPIRNAVVMPVDLDVVIDMNTRFFSLGIDVCRSR